MHLEQAMGFVFSLCLLVSESIEYMRWDVRGEGPDWNIKQLIRQTFDPDGKSTGIVLVQWVSDLTRKCSIS